MSKIKKDEIVVHKASNENKQSFIKRSLPYVIGFCISIGALSGVSHLAFRTFGNDLPSNKNVERVLNEYGLNSEVAMQKGLDRFVFPRSGVVKVNVKIKDLDDHTKEVFQESVDDINALLKIINPKYKLELNYNPGLFDNLYAINVKQKSLDAETLGTCAPGFIMPTVNGTGRYVSNVALDIEKMKADPFNPDAVLKNTFIHEVAGHGLFALGDAYKVDGFTADTVMQSSGKVDSPGFYPLDIKTAIVKMTKDADSKKLDEAVEKYYNSTEYYIKKLDEAKYFKENVYNYAKKSAYMGHEEFDASKMEFSNFDEVYSRAYYNTYVNALGSVNGSQTEYLYSFNNGDVKLDSLDIGGCKSITKYSCNNGIVDLDGLTYSMSQDSYYLKYDNQIFKACIEEQKDGERKIEFYTCGNIISKEEYDTRMSTYLRVVNQYNVQKLEGINVFEKNDNLLKVYDDIAKYYVLMGKKQTKLPELVGLTFGNGKKVDKLNQYEITFGDFGKSDRACLKYKDLVGNMYMESNAHTKYIIHNDMAILYTGDCVLNTDKGLYCFNLEYDSLNGGFKPGNHSGYVDKSTIKYQPMEEKIN